MRSRCLNSNNARYAQYGGRGVAIDAAWKNFAVFREWALANGYTTKLPVLIDRVDTDGPYSPTNCRWVCRLGSREGYYAAFEAAQISEKGRKSMIFMPKMQVFCGDLRRNTEGEEGRKLTRREAARIAAELGVILSSDYGSNKKTKEAAGRTRFLKVGHSMDKDIKDMYRD